MAFTRISILSIVWRGVLFRAEVMMAIGKHSKEIGLIIRIIIDGIIPMQVHLKVDSIRPNTRSVRVRLPSPPPKKEYHTHVPAPTSTASQRKGDVYHEVGLKASI